MKNLNATVQSAGLESTALSLHVLTTALKTETVLKEFVFAIKDSKAPIVAENLAPIIAIVVVNVIH